MSAQPQPDFAALDAAIAARWHSPEQDARLRRSRSRARARAAWSIEDPDDIRSRWFRGYLESRDAPQAKQRGNSAWKLPDFSGLRQVLKFAGEWGASAEQLAQARELANRGQTKKARRVALCGMLGRRVNCQDCGGEFLRRFGCNTRYCLLCGERIGRKLYAKWAEKLLPAVEKVVEFKRRQGVKEVIAKLDLTAGSRKPLREGGRMPTPAEVKKFNRDVWRFRRALERRYGLTRDSYLLLGMNEIGGANNNLHRHSIYVGPWLPQRMKELTRLWSKVRGETAYASIKLAASVPAALAHALHYPLKFLSSSTPERLAALEATFAGARRFFVAGALYRAEPPSRAPGADESLDGGCPRCGGLLVEPAMGFGGGWLSARALEAEGRQDLAVVRSSAQVRFAEHVRRADSALKGSGP